MIAMRWHLLLLCSAMLTLASCKLWNPDYEPDPSVTLQKLLQAFERTDRPVKEVERNNIRDSIVRLATRYSSHVPSQVAAAALDWESGRVQSAQRFVDRAMSLDPGNVEARSLRVRIAIADGNKPLARKVVDDGLRLRPDATALYEASAWLYQLDGRWVDALQALDRAEALEAPKWRVEFHRGLCRELQEDFDTAEKHYQAAIDANANCVQAKQRLAGLAARKK